MLGCDIVVTAGSDALGRMVSGRTRVVANLASTPTADFTRDADIEIARYVRRREGKYLLLIDFLEGDSIGQIALEKFLTQIVGDLWVEEKAGLAEQLHVGVNQCGAELIHPYVRLFSQSCFVHLPHIPHNLRDDCLMR